MSWERHVEDQERAAIGEWIMKLIAEAKEIFADADTFRVAIEDAIEEAEW